MACHGHGVRVQHPSKAEIRSSLEKSSAQTSRPDAAAGDLFLKPTQRWERFGQQQSYGYGSIPIDTFLMGWTSIYQLFWGSLGTRVLTHSHMYHMWRSLVSLLGTIATYCNHRNVRMPFFLARLPSRTGIPASCRDSPRPWGQVERLGTGGYSHEFPIYLVNYSSWWYLMIDDCNCCTLWNLYGSLWNHYGFYGLVMLKT